jgi:predicted transcriptional regulator
MAFPFAARHRQATALRGLAHPIRLQLLALLADEGQLTSTRAGALTGETVANCSFHLRQLAKYGFVEATAGDDRRHHPWRLVRDHPLQALPLQLVGAAADTADERRRRELFASQLRIFDPDTLAAVA